MKKNSLELKRRQIQMLIEAENAAALKRSKRMANRASKAEEGDVVMKKQKFKRGRVLPRREYKAKRRQDKLHRTAPELVDGDVDMEKKRTVPVSKTMRLVKDKSSIHK